MTGTFDGARLPGHRAHRQARASCAASTCSEIDEDGKITRNTGYYDGAEFARQIGMLPPQDSGAERAMRTGFNAVTKIRREIASRR